MTVYRSNWPRRKRGCKVQKTPAYRLKWALRVRRSKKPVANQAQQAKPAAQKKRRRRRNLFVTRFFLQGVAFLGILLGMIVALTVFKDAVIASILLAW